MQGSPGHSVPLPALWNDGGAWHQGAGSPECETWICWGFSTLAWRRGLLPCLRGSPELWLTSSGSELQPSNYMAGLSAAPSPLPETTGVTVPC